MTPLPDPLLLQLSGMIDKCRMSNDDCQSCAVFRQCSTAWSRLNEIAGVRLLTGKDYALFYKRFNKILRNQVGE